MSRRAIIIGAGPAGLTAAYELLQRTDIIPSIVEQSNQIGGLAKTVEYKGNHMDLGGHRFFSKSDRVMRWWLDMLPLQRLPENAGELDIPGGIDPESGPDPDREDRVMLLRPRQSRIYFEGKFYDYPVTLSLDTLVKLGPVRMTRIGFSYLRRLLFPIKPEDNLEQFIINRFGETLYKTFFKSYTEKVWGVPCQQISADWGAQRIRNVSVGRSIIHWLVSLTNRSYGIAQKEIPTSLIEQFLYPKFGPGQMWQQTAEAVKEGGGTIRLQHTATKLHVEKNRVVAVTVRNNETGSHEEVKGDYVFSTMPVHELIPALDNSVPDSVKTVAANLRYRDFITIGLLVKKVASDSTRLKDALSRVSWIYIQAPDVRVGRLQIYNNWSPYMVRNSNHLWLGIEYYCDKGDSLWRCSDKQMLELGSEELTRLGIIRQEDVIDGVVLRVEKAYPAYFGAYKDFGAIRNYVDQIGNLYLIGRNGMHRYNNQDHSMLTAMIAVDNIAAGSQRKDNIWAVNTEEKYHEEKVES